MRRGGGAGGVSICTVAFISARHKHSLLVAFFSFFFRFRRCLAIIWSWTCSAAVEQGTSRKQERVALVALNIADVTFVRLHDSRLFPVVYSPSRALFSCDSVSCIRQRDGKG